MKARELFFTGPGSVALRDAEMPQPGPQSVLVETWYSGISAGTELLLYRGQAPAGMALDENLPALSGEITYPFKYGYAAVGRVIALGAGADPEFQGRMVFSFQPHQSHFSASQDDVFLLPEAFSPEQGIFLPNMETAVNFMLDGRPVLGENVAVIGQGIVGLLTTWLLAKFPLGRLDVFDRLSQRREMALRMGAKQAAAGLAETRGSFAGYDLVYEISGSPDAINGAVAWTRYDGRIVLGSWYGDKEAALSLGGPFHRSRIRLISSQVSTIAPRDRGRWTKTRRFAVAARMLRDLPYESLITHRLPFQSAAEAYALLDRLPGEALQVLLEYPPASEGGN